MRPVKITGTPPSDWLAEAAIATGELKATAAIKIESKNYTLGLFPGLATKAALPAAGKSVVVVGEVKNTILVRIFDSTGSLLTEYEQGKREPAHSPVYALRSLLEQNWDATKLKPFEVAELFRLVTKIAIRGLHGQIIAKQEKLWGDTRIKSWLLDQFSWKCWYSEAKESVSPTHVDHYRPKGSVSDDVTDATEDGYWWLAFEWMNYRISGHLLNSKKTDVFPFSTAARAQDIGSIETESPVLIDPKTADARLISYERTEAESCEACFAGALQPDEQDRAKRTIEIIGLNRPTALKRKRAEFWEDCLTQIGNWKGATANKSPFLRQAAQAGPASRLKAMIAYGAEFSSISEACIRKNAPEALVASVFDPHG